MVEPPKNGGHIENPQKVKFDNGHFFMGCGFPLLHSYQHLHHPRTHIVDYGHKYGVRINSFHSFQNGFFLSIFINFQ